MNTINLTSSTMTGSNNETSMSGANLMQSNTMTGANHALNVILGNLDASNVSNPLVPSNSITNALNNILSSEKTDGHHHKTESKHHVRKLTIILDQERRKSDEKRRKNSIKETKNRMNNTLDAHMIKKLIEIEMALEKSLEGKELNVDNMINVMSILMTTVENYNIQGFLKKDLVIKTLKKKIAESPHQKKLDILGQVIPEAIDAIVGATKEVLPQIDKIPTKCCVML